MTTLVSGHALPLLSPVALDSYLEASSPVALERTTGWFLGDQLHEFYDYEAVDK